MFTLHFLSLLLTENVPQNHEVSIQMFIQYHLKYKGKVNLSHFVAVTIT